MSNMYLVPDEEHTSFILRQHRMIMGKFKCHLTIGKGPYKKRRSKPLFFARWCDSKGITYGGYFRDYGELRVLILTELNKERRLSVYGEED